MTVGLANDPDYAAVAPEQGNHIRLFVSPRFERTEFLAASLQSHRYALHSHDTFVIGGINSGCGTLFIRGSQRRASTGDLTLYNPGEAHDGGPGVETGFRYRVSYPSLDLMTRIGMDVSGRSRIGTPSFRSPIVRDEQGLAAFSAAHRAIECAGDTLAGDERLFAAFAHVLIRHADIAPACVGREQGPIQRVIDIIAERFSEDIPLAELAAEAGLSRFHLIRAFHRHTGLTPHAYLINRRVEIAKARLRSGERLADVATATGFADQAHLTRVFKMRVGITPGMYRAATAQ
jgi:AraC-like DNA-binding protein